MVVAAFKERLLCVSTETNPLATNRNTQETGFVLMDYHDLSATAKRILKQIAQSNHTILLDMRRAPAKRAQTALLRGHNFLEQKLPLYQPAIRRHHREHHSFFALQIGKRNLYPVRGAA